MKKMNIENEKMWFVYIGDHHEGPFSPDEISEKMSAGVVTKESYVWCEGMSDWIALSEAKDLLNSLPQTAPPPATGPSVSKTEPKEKREQTLTNLSPLKEKTSTIIVPKKSKLPLILGVVVILLIALSFGTLSLLSKFSSEGFHAKLRPTLIKVVSTAPFLAPLFRQTPNVTDVKPEEAEELEHARTVSPETEVKIGVALSQADSNRPAFYISTNLPDGTSFNISVVGNRETLLNRLDFTSQATVLTRTGFGKSEVFLGDGGQLIPKGEYQVTVVDSTDPTHKVMKTYFLGGPRDETYLTRVKQFHEKIIQNANRELLELKQYTDTLSLQFTTLTGEFTRIYQSKKMSASLKQAWMKDAETWKQINTQLEQTVQTWSPETLQNEFFYGKVYGYVKSSYDSIKNLFLMENTYVQAPSDRSLFDIQHGKAVSEANQSLELLKTKMDLILKAPKTPSGLPTKDGL